MRVNISNIPKKRKGRSRWRKSQDFVKSFVSQASTHNKAIAKLKGMECKNCYDVSVETVKCVHKSPYHTNLFEVYSKTLIQNPFE